MRALILLLMVSSSWAADIGPAMAVATATDGATVTLHTGRGVCVGHAYAAIWRPPPGSAEPDVPGCWVLEGTTVLVSFLDGARGNIPAGHLVKVRGT
jgi:hypothetical protein